jgi:hypothetical protein
VFHLPRHGLGHGHESRGFRPSTKFFVISSIDIWLIPFDRILTARTSLAAHLLVFVADNVKAAAPGGAHRQKNEQQRANELSHVFLLCCCATKDITMIWKQSSGKWGK